MDLPLHGPGADSGFLAIDKIREVYGSVLGPDTSRASEVRDTRFRTDPCASEAYDIARFLYSLGKILQRHGQGSAVTSSVGRK